MSVIDQSKSKVKKAFPNFYCLSIQKDGEIGIFLNEIEQIHLGTDKKGKVWKSWLTKEQKDDIKVKHNIDIDTY